MNGLGSSKELQAVINSKYSVIQGLSELIDNRFSCFSMITSCTYDISRGCMSVCRCSVKSDIYIHGSQP